MNKHIKVKRVFLLDIKETVAVVPIPILGDPEILLRKRGLPVEYVIASSFISLDALLLLF